MFASESKSLQVGALVKHSTHVSSEHSLSSDKHPSLSDNRRDIYDDEKFYKIGHPQEKLFELKKKKKERKKIKRFRSIKKNTFDIKNGCCIYSAGLCH